MKPYQSVSPVRRAEAYRQSFDSGLAAYRRVLDRATDDQRPHLGRYMTAFAYWHLHCRRYRWSGVHPGPDHDRHLTAATAAENPVTRTVAPGILVGHG
ncbi:hypothetical protein ACPC54_29660 [Kitasatospora sp. NPDC094028]